MTGIVAIFCRAECLGGWTSFWAPCMGTWPFATGFAYDIKDEGVMMRTLAEPLLFRNSICKLRLRMKGRDCMEATLDNLVWLLYPKFAQYT
eukprot:2648141-Amphidinium_carterae.1